ncbi:MAG TPA: hypothetical protein VGG55_00410 [Candidatus Acidoferrales bacterium]
MRQRKLINTGLAAAVLLAGAAAWAVPQNQPQTPTPAERNAYQAARDESDAQAKIKLLDDFTTQYPDSPLLPETYADYYLAYFSLKNYSETIAYADKLVALGDKVDPGSRIVALVSREIAYSEGCADSALQTPEALAKTKDAAAQGLQMLSEWQKPADLPANTPINVNMPNSTPVNLTNEQFAAQKRTFGIIFNQVAGVAEAGLKGGTVNCAPPPPIDPANFERMIEDLKALDRQGPRVR